MIMKLHRFKINRKKIKNNLSRILGVVLVSVAIIALGVEAFAAHEKGNYEGGSGGGSFSTPACSGYVCWNVTSDGAFWVEYTYNGPTAASRLGFNYGIWRDDTISDCKVGSKFYVLATRLHYGNKAAREWGVTEGGTAGAKGMLSIGEVYSRGQTLDGRQDNITSAMLGGGRIVPEATAKAQYDRFADEHIREGHPYAAGSDLTWFCGEKDTTTTTTITRTDDPPRTACSATKYRYLANTESRIAVQNMSLDGRTNRPDLNPVKARGVRSPLHTDSGLTMESDNSVQTIAKPGDSVYFYHCISMTVRYGGWVPNQDSWNSGEQGYSNNYPNGTNHFKIEAFPNNNFLFDEGQISNINSQTANVTALNTALFTPNSGLDIFTSGDRYGIDVVAPIGKSSTYNCKNIAWYNSRDPFIKGGFQIPGFKTGSCDSASKVGISNLVGRTFGQKHTFNALTVWERYHHSRWGGCSCGDNSAGAINYGDYGEYPGSFSGTPGKIQLPYQCGPRGANDCNWTCDNCCDRYGNCISGSYKDYYYPWVSTANNGTGYFMYHKMEKDYGNKTKKATVYTPYNFETTTGSGIDEGDVIFQGSSVSSNFTWKIKKRTNNATSSFAYATITPSNTKIQMVEFILAPDAEQAVEGKIDAKKDPCAYYTAEKRGAVNCNIIDEKGGEQNPEGRYSGKSYSASYIRLVPDNDEYVGYKYCVAVGIWPSDSHDYMGNELWQQYSTGEGGAMDAGQYWNISSASCRTIAKKPSFQVWNGSIYTQGTINTSLSQKMTGKSGGEEKGNNFHYNQTAIFGSWADYAIVTDDESINGISSGAVLGYHNGKYNLSGGGGIATTVASNYTNLSPMTISNSSGSGSVGIGRVNASTSINTNLQRLNSRYRDKAKTYASDASEGAYGSQPTINTASTGTQYVYYNGSTNISSIGIRRASSKPNQTTRREGSNLIKTIGDGVNDNTLIIYVTGDLTIDQNICLGTGCSNDPTKLRTYNTISTNASAKLPQIIIFANNVYVTQDVNRIDAWLIVPNGTIDTCKGFNIGNNLAARDAKQRYTDYGNCYKTLVVNGPIYTNNIALKRTAGNNHGFAPDDNIDVLDRSLGSTGECTIDRNGNINNRYPCDATKGSVAPAEIFNLRADTYIWAYNQAERYSEAVVTYTRELAPRY